MNDLLIGNNLNNIPRVKIGLRGNDLISKMPKDKDIDLILDKIKKYGLIFLICFVLIYATYRIIIGLY